MNLQEDQRARVRVWIEQGLQPAEIQKKLTEEFGLNVTYMEVRFLLTDLDLKPKDKEPPPPAVPVGASSKLGGAPPASVADASVSGTGARPGNAVGGVSVSVDQVTRAGALVSGRVAFSDGKSADWYLDQAGRLGLAPKEKGYKPSQTDLMEFQTLLQDELAKLGF